MATYYVDATSGDDAKNGLSEANAWKTISKVNGESFSAGDSILFKRGEEWREQLTVPSSGSDGSPITFGAYGSGAKPIINGADIVETWTEANSANSLETVDNEEGDLSDWDSTYTGNNGVIVAHSDAARSGSYGTKCTCDGTSNCQVRAGLSFEAQAEVYEKFYFSINALTMADGDQFFLWTTNQGGSCMELQLRRSGSDYQISADGSSWTTFSKTDFQEVTIHHLAHASAGFYKAWIGSTQIRNSTGLSNADRTVTTLQHGLYVQVDAGTSGDLYIDDVSVYDAEPKDNIWQATLTTEPNQVFFDGTRGNKQTSLNDVDSANDWYWDSNVLYVYYTEDPDGAVSIEASVRATLIDFNEKNYITVYGLTVKHANGDAIFIDGDNFVIQNCTSIYNYNSNIVVWGATASITAGTISSNTSSYSQTGQGIFIGYSSAGPTGITVEYNIVNNNGTEAGDCGIYLNRADSNIIRFNNVYSNYDNNIQFQNGSDSNQCYYNLSYESAAGSGIWIGTGDGGDSNLVYNNVVFNNFVAGINLGAGSGNIIKNNICYQDKDIVGAYAAPLKMTADVGGDQTFDNNCYYYANQEGSHRPVRDHTDTYITLAAWQTASGGDANSIDSDPLMTDPANGDFTLQVGSPCINTGTDVGLTEDYAGNPVDANPDIGAYEYQDIDSPGSASLGMNLDLD